MHGCKTSFDIGAECIILDSTSPFRSIDPISSDFLRPGLIIQNKGQANGTIGDVDLTGINHCTVGTIDIGAYEAQ